MLKNEFQPELTWFETICAFVDLGYQGIQTDYEGENLEIPNKKPLKSKKNPKPELTVEQKAEKRTISRVGFLSRTPLQELNVSTFWCMLLATVKPR